MGVGSPPFSSNEDAGLFFWHFISLSEFFVRSFSTTFYNILGFAETRWCGWFFMFFFLNKNIYTTTEWHFVIVHFCNVSQLVTIMRTLCTFYSDVTYDNVWKWYSHRCHSPRLHLYQMWKLRIPPTFNDNEGF